MLKLQILSSAIKIVLVLSIADSIAALCSSFVGLSPRSVFGDLLLLEAAVFFVIGGMLDFAKSAGVVQLRRVLFGKKESVLASSKGTDSSIVSVFMIAGLLMLAGTILMVMIDVAFPRFPSSEMFLGAIIFVCYVGR